MMYSKIDQAINFFENRNLNESKKLCLEILKDEPKNFDALHLSGIIYFHLKNYKKLISELKLKEYKFSIIRHRKKNALLQRIFKNFKRN